jgi:ubiquinone biosynthesis protein UbiJ
MTKLELKQKIEDLEIKIAECITNHNSIWTFNKELAPLKKELKELKRQYKEAQ